MARLVNGADTAVEPTENSITTAISNFGESAIPGVTTFNSSIDASGAYPLATVAYAAVSVCDATIDQLKNYNKLLSFAKGKGQVVGAERGDLPEGYVPLTASQKESLGSMIRAINSEISSQCVPNTRATRRLILVCSLRYLPLSHRQRSSLKRHKTNSAVTILMVRTQPSSTACSRHCSLARRSWLVGDCWLETQKPSMVSTPFTLRSGMAPKIRARAKARVGRKQWSTPLKGKQ